MYILFKMPKVQIIFILLALFFVVSPFFDLSNAVYLFLLCVGFSVAIDSAITYVRRKTFVVPYAALVTGLILTLIIDPQATWHQILIICAAAIGVKNLSRQFAGRVLTNPATTGLFVGWLLFGLNPSWWGATLYGGSENLLLNVVTYILIIGIAYVSCFKLKKYPAVFAYLIGYLVLYVLLGSASIDSAIKTAISPGVLFFAFLMVPEPMSSPVKKHRQLLYGALIAALSVFFVWIMREFQLENVPDFSIAALLIANILFFKFR